MNKKTHFPLFISTADKKVVIIGGGNIATRRTKALLNFEFDLTVISPKFSQELLELKQESKLMLVQDEYNEKYLKDAYIVLACTDDKQCNKQIADYCKIKGILVNSCSEKDDCDFFFPALMLSKEQIIGMVGNGENHSKTKNIANKIREIIHET